MDLLIASTAGEPESAPIDIEGDNETTGKEATAATELNTDDMAVDEVETGSSIIAALGSTITVTAGLKSSASFVDLDSKHNDFSFANGILETPMVIDEPPKLQSEDATEVTPEIQPAPDSSAPSLLVSTDSITTQAIQSAIPTDALNISDAKIPSPIVMDAVVPSTLSSNGSFPAAISVNASALTAASTEGIPTSVPAGSDAVAEDKPATPVVSDIPNELIVDLEKLAQIEDELIKKCKYRTVAQLESMGVALAGVVRRFRDLWDRTQMLEVSFGKNVYSISYYITIC
jgi:hypothetical protein